MKKYLLNTLLFFIIVAPLTLKAQDLNQKYEIKIWTKNYKGIYVESHQETLGFLPVFKNTRDEITIGNNKFILESTLNLQIIESKENKIKVSLDFKNEQKQFHKELVINEKEILDLEDFKLEIDKK